MIDNNKLVVNREVSQENGNTTWTVVDIMQEVDEGVFHVFNTFTGLPETCTTLLHAQTRFQELAEEINARFQLATPAPLSPMHPHVNFTAESTERVPNDRVPLKIKAL